MTTGVAGWRRVAVIWGGGATPWLDFDEMGGERTAARAEI